VVKRWNSEVFEIVQEFPSATVGFRDEASDEETETEDDSEEGWERRGETLPDLCGKIAYDMFRLGITKDFDYDISAEEFFDESLVETLEVWTYNKMQELITSKSTGEGISAKVLEDYLDERLSDSLAEQAAAMYGGEEQFEELIGFLLGTFGYRGFPFDGHEFTVSINIPGTLLGISPLPRDVEDVRSLWELPRTPSGKNLITWKFQQGAFYPDGIILAATVVIPDEKNQLRIFKQVVLDTETEKADFAESMIWKKWDELSYSLEILRQCLKEGSTTALTSGDQLDEDEMQDEGFVRDLLELLESEKGTEEEE